MTEREMGEIQVGLAGVKSDIAQYRAQCAADCKRLEEAVERLDRSVRPNVAAVLSAVIACVTVSAGSLAAVTEWLVEPMLVRVVAIQENNDAMARKLDEHIAWAMGQRLEIEKRIRENGVAEKHGRD